MRLVAVVSLCLLGCGAAPTVDGHWRGLWSVTTNDVATRDSGTVAGLDVADGQVSGAGTSSGGARSLAISGVIHDDGNAALTLALGAATYATAGPLVLTRGSGSNPDRLAGTMNLYVGDALSGTARLELARE